MGPNHGSDPWALSLMTIDMPARLPIARDYPAWRAWPGTIAGVLYARRPRTSPPLVVRATTTDQLRLAIEDAERKRGLR